MTALCGWKAANRWGLTGDHFDAQEALRIGMVNEVVPHEQLMERPMRWRERHGAGAGTGGAAEQGDCDAGHPGGRPARRLCCWKARSARWRIPRTTSIGEELFDIQRTQGIKAYLEGATGRSSPSRWARARQSNAAKPRVGVEGPDGCS